MKRAKLIIAHTQMSDFIDACQAKGFIYEIVATGKTMNSVEILKSNDRTFYDSDVFDLGIMFESLSNGLKAIQEGEKRENDLVRVLELFTDNYISDGGYIKAEHIIIARQAIAGEAIEWS